MKKIVLILFLFLNFELVYAQIDSDESYEVNTIAFYNVENLFDTINDPLTRDDDRTPMGKDKWTVDIYRKKLLNLSKVINEIGADLTGESPTIIGLCEVENKKVLVDLINTKLLKISKYEIIHYDSPDERGVDVALIYKKGKFKPTSSKIYPLHLKTSTGEIDFTRDHLLVSGYLNNEKIHFIVNHWPSRAGGQMKSEKKRISAGLLNRKIIDSILRINPVAKIINMGDFNDNPNDKSIKPILKTSSLKENLSEGELFNPMDILFKKGYGTYKFRGRWDMLDQFMLTQSLILENEGHFFLKASVYSKKYMVNPKGKYQGYPYKSFAGGRFLDGFSDHFPIYLYLAKKTNNN